MADPSERTDMSIVRGKQTAHDPHHFRGKSGRQHPILAFIEREYGFDHIGVRLCLLEIGKLIEFDIEISEASLRKMIEHDIASADDHAARERRRQQERERNQVEVVYYMRLGNRVKIGWTTNLTVRRAAIQPEEVMVTEPGGQKLEYQRHQQFKHLRVSGEWFRLEGPLADHIDALRSK